MLEYRGTHRNDTWKSVGRIRTANGEGYLLAHVRIGAAGTIRLAWTNPSTGRTFTSRNVSLS